MTLWPDLNNGLYSTLLFTVLSFYGYTKVLVVDRCEAGTGGDELL
jgi:hypothetical protein